ncbi:13509_t:CDS:2, partial [Ambispora gerdemannii]
MDDEWLEYTNEECFEYHDPDIDYEILDDNESYLENVSEIPTPKTITDESVTTDNECINDITFDKRALNHAKNFAASTLEDLALEQDERDINWLTLDVDLQSEVGSMWTLPMDDSHAIDYEIGGEADINRSNNQCVIIDYVEGHFQRCLNPVYRPIKQLMGIWELDFQALNIALKAGTEKTLTNLGKDHEFVRSFTSQTRSKFVCSHCFNNEGGHFFQRKGKGLPQFSCTEKHVNDNQLSLHLLGRWIQEMSTDQDQQLQAILLEEVWSAIVKFLDKKTSISKDSTNNTNANQVIQINPPTYFGIRAALRMKKVNLRRLEEKNRYIDLITNQSQELGEALGTVVWRSRSE